MIVLALETSHLPGTIALVNDSQLMEYRRLDPNTTTTAQFSTVVRQVLTDAGFAPDQVDFVAVSLGPGSFTGLRIGVAWAKMWAFASRARVIPVSTLETIADQTPSDFQGEIVSAIDAQRGEVFSATFRRDPEGLHRLTPNTLLSVEHWTEQWKPDQLITGPALRLVSPSQLDEKSNPRTLPESWVPDAKSLIRLARQKIARGQHADPWTLVPDYGRKSAAEERVLGT